MLVSRIFISSKNSATICHLSSKDGVLNKAGILKGNSLLWSKKKKKKQVKECKVQTWFNTRISFYVFEAVVGIKRLRVA